MPENTVYVGRGSGFGNPFSLDEFSNAQICVDYFKEWLYSSVNQAVMMRSKLQTIRGKDLACWCPDNSPCHADVLIEAANAY